MVPPVAPASPTKRTIEFLQKTWNSAAVATLAACLDGPNSPLRPALVEALSRRPEREAAQSLARHFFKFDARERDLAAPRIKKIPEYLSDLLQSSQIDEQRSALAAICDFDWAQFVPQVVRIASDPTHPLYTDAQEQIRKWSIRLGLQVRTLGKCSPARLLLVDQLYRVLVEQHQPLPWLIESFIGILHWDDSVVRLEFFDNRRPVLESLKLHLQSTIQPASLAFLGGFLWQRHIPDWIEQILLERQDSALAIWIAEHASHSFTHQVRSHLQRMPELACTQPLETADPHLSPNAKFGILRLRGVQSPSTRDLLQTALTCLQHPDSWTEKAVIELLQMLPTGESTPQGSLSMGRFNDLIHPLLDHFSTSSPAIQDAIRRLFHDITLDEMIRHADDWDERRLQNAGRIISLLDLQWIEKMHEELQSGSPLRRQRAATVLRFFEVPHVLWEPILERLNEENETIRCRALEAMIHSEYQELDTLLESLLQDANEDIRYLARYGLDQQASRASLVIPRSVR